MAFLLALDELSFGKAGEPAGVFVDELDLPRRHEDERGGAPDQAVLWDDRLWLIELKTVPSSHRRDQLPSYFELGAHHFPGTRVDITYLTPAMSVPAPAVIPPNSPAHVTWENVATLVHSLWGTSDDAAERNVAGTLQAALETLGTPVSTWRLQAGTPEAGPHSATPAPSSDAPLPPSAPPTGPDAASTAALESARLTSVDGHQRAVELEQSSLEGLQGLRLQIREQLCNEPPDSPLRHVMPRLWSAQTSGGAALTASGNETGYELRLSRYQRPIC